MTSAIASFQIRLSWYCGNSLTTTVLVMRPRDDGGLRNIGPVYAHVVSCAFENVPGFNMRAAYGGVSPSRFS